MDVLLAELFESEENADVLPSLAPQGVTHVLCPVTKDRQLLPGSLLSVDIPPVVRFVLNETIHCS